MRILFVRACAIGDFVLQLPALRALGARYPGAKFTLVGYPPILELARVFIPVESIHSIETGMWSRLFSGPVSGLDFDKGFVWMRNPEFSENLQRSGLNDVFHGNPRPKDGHAGDHLLQTLGLDAPELPDFWVQGSPRTLLHPGSGSKTKIWPYFPQLAAQIEEVAIVRGPLEMALPFPGKPSVQASSLMALADEICHSRIFVGNDSGITHLAAYWGAPTVALFGPTDPGVWGPVGRRVWILAKSSLADISVEEVRNLLT